MHVDREKLYDEIWTEPMQYVAMRYGISDVALRKNCLKMNIPLPPKGMWARFKHGYKIVRTPLPPMPENSQQQPGAESKPQELEGGALATAQAELACSPDVVILRPRYLTERGASVYTSIPARSFKYWREVGRGPAFLRPGKRVLYDVAVLDEWLNQHGHTFLVRKFH